MTEQDFFFLSRLFERSDEVCRGRVFKKGEEEASGYVG